MALRVTFSLTLLALAGVTLPAVDVSATTLAGGAHAGGNFTVVDSLGGITGPGGTAGNLTVSLGQVPRIFQKSRPVVFNSRHVVNAGSVLTQTVVATDGDNDPISLSVVTQPRLGVLSFAANGQFTYTANADVGGVDTFTVSGSDGVATSDTATITVTIAANQTVTRALIPGLAAPYQNLKAGTPVTVAVIGGKPPYTFTTTNGSAKPIAPFRFLDVDGDGQLDTGAIGQLIPQASSSAISEIPQTLTIRDSTGSVATVPFTVQFVAPIIEQPKPVLPTSPQKGNVTLFGALGGQTPEGTEQLRAAFNNVSAKVAVGYVWDAAVQDYTTLPNQPSGGLSADNGIFIAARVELPVDLGGTPTQLPHDIVLQPGWNFIAVPSAVDISGKPISSFNSVSDVFYKEVDGTSLTGSQQTTNVGDEFYAWDGTVYEPSLVLETGHAYWVENISTNPARPLLMTLKPGAGVSVPKHATRSARPPLPPGSSAVSDSLHDVSSGCGSGSGLAVIMVGMLALLGSFRRRSHR